MDGLSSAELSVEPKPNFTPPLKLCFDSGVYFYPGFIKIGRLVSEKNYEQLDIYTELHILYIDCNTIKLIRILVN